MDCEILLSHRESRKGLEMLAAMQAASPVEIRAGTAFRRNADILMLWGVGRKGHAQARDAQLAIGRRAVLWDVGYFSKDAGYYRVSIDHQHPQALMDRTPVDSSRWAAHGIRLREVADPAGPILLVGTGPKSHTFLGTHGWEARKLVELKRRFPGREIVFRPKPRRPFQPIACRLDRSETIEQALTGKSLVVCRHSNVAVDACIAGVPVECEDGAAVWMQGKPYTRMTRLDFLHRLSWWQWKPEEAGKAWAFLLGAMANAA